jgi:hypothetical protein
VRKRRHLTPLILQIMQPWRRWTLRRPKPEIAAAALVLATTDIRRIISDAFADRVAPAGQGSVPIATLEAHFVNLCATAYGWSPDFTAGMPLRQLLQLSRCHRRDQGETIEDPGEQEILVEHIRAKNVILAAERELKARQEKAEVSP